MSRPALHASPAASAAPALWLTLLMGVTFALLWSSAFSVAKVLVADAPPFALSAARFILAGMIAGGIAFSLGQRLPTTARAWRAIVLLGLCQNTIYLGLFFTAMTTIPAGLAAIIASAMPLVVAAAAPALVGERVGRAQAVGLLVGFAGVVWIMGYRLAGGVDAFGVTLAILGTLALSLATLTIKKGDFGAGLLMVVACQMAVGALGCIPIALIFEDVTAFNTSPEWFAAFAYQIFGPGIAATLLWFALVKRVSTAEASAFHFLNPIFGVGFAFVLLSEPLSWRDGIGVTAAALGIFIVNRAGVAARARAKAAETTAETTAETAAVSRSLAAPGPGRGPASPKL